MYVQDIREEKVMEEKNGAKAWSAWQIQGVYIKQREVEEIRAHTGNANSLMN